MVLRTMRCLFKLLLLFSLLKQEIHIISAQNTLPGRVSRPSVTTASKISAASSSIQANSSSSASSSRSMIDNHTQVRASATAVLPIPVYPNTETTGDRRATESNQDIKSATCAMKDLYCSSNKSSGAVGNVNATGVEDLCSLWDPTCSGNRTLARDKFFDPDFQRDVLRNRCFVLEGSVNLGNASNCDKYNPPGRMSEFQKMKNWMRSQQCASAGMPRAAPFDRVLQDDGGSHMINIALDMEPYEYRIVSGTHPSCCDVCETNVKNVDIYYWPERDVNTSCLSIIGDTVRPVTFGASTKLISEGTTITTNFVWTCTPKSSAYYDTSLSATLYDPVLYTTAMIRTIGTLLVKVYLADPWSPSPCIETVMSQQSNGSVTTQDQHARMHAREHTLILSSSVTHIDISPVTTMVSGNFTFTSPSVYANFHGIQATDQCGGISILSTMIAFAPGELSTFAGPLREADGLDTSVFTSKSFNLNDLPCPPQSVMEENWYKPQPGEPYRPLIAFPNKLKEMISWLSHCDNQLFTAYDPPSTLKPGTALIPPPVPYSDPKANPRASPTLNREAGQTIGAKTLVPLPANTPILDQPKATATTASNPTRQKEPDPGAQEGPSPQSQSGKTVTNSDPKGSNDPDHGSDPLQSGGSDPYQGSDDKGDTGQVHESQGSDQHADPTLQDDQKEIFEVDPSDDFTAGQTKTINGQVVQLLSHGISIAGTTMTRGAAPITVSGTPIHFGSSALIIGTSKVPLTPGVPTHMTINIGGQAVIAASDVVAIAGSTLSPGAPGTIIDGTVLSLDPVGRFVVGSKTVSLLASEKVPQTITTNIAGQAITAAPNAIIVAGTTLHPGAPGTTLAGTVISLNMASQLIIGPKTLDLESSHYHQSSLVTEIGGGLITAAPNGITMANTALTRGAAGVTVGGTLVSFNAAGQLIVGPKTINTLEDGSQRQRTLMGEPGIGALLSSSSLEVGNPTFVTTSGDQVITADPTALVLAGSTTTLTPGAPALTINGTPISLNSAVQLILGSKTIPLPGSNTQTADLSALILKAFGPGGPFNSSASLARGNNSVDNNGGGVNGTSAAVGVKVFEGDGGASLRRRWWMAVGMASRMAALVYGWMFVFNYAGLV